MRISLDVRKLLFITNTYQWKFPLSSLTIYCIFHVLIHFGSTYGLSGLFLKETVLTHSTS